MTIFEDEITNKKTLENANLFVTETRSLANEIMLNIMQNFNFDFLKKEFWTDCGVLSELYTFFPWVFFQCMEEY